MPLRIEKITITEELQLYLIFIYIWNCHKYKNVKLFLRILCQGYKLYDAIRLIEKNNNKNMQLHSHLLPPPPPTHFLNTPIRRVILPVVKLEELVQKLHLNFNLQSQFYYSVIIYWHTPSSLPPQGEDEPMATPRMTINHA